jgi:hypothetical protein
VKPAAVSSASSLLPSSKKVLPASSFSERKASTIAPRLDSRQTPLR